MYAATLTDPVTIALRSELYVEAYDSIDWGSTRHLVAPMDNYSAIPTVMRVIQVFGVLCFFFYFVQILAFVSRANFVGWIHI